MKKVLALLLFSWMGAISASPRAEVFVSFSMPEQLLEETLSESARLKIPAILNGLHENSMPLTVAKIMALSKKISHLNLQIDPTAFTRFGIHQVPALVVLSEQGFDVIYGNISIARGLERIAERSDVTNSGLTAHQVRRLLGE
jgi:conjugal transfer pilus assembly protein TrbC